MPHIAHPKRKFDPRPGRTSTVGPNSAGKVPITRIAPVGEPDVSRTPAEILCEAIELHLDLKYAGGKVTDPLDGLLYPAAVWFRTWQDHARDPDAPILDV